MSPERDVTAKPSPAATLVRPAIGGYRAHLHPGPAAPAADAASPVQHCLKRSIDIARRRPAHATPPDERPTAQRPRPRRKSGG